MNKGIHTQESITNSQSHVNMSQKIYESKIKIVNPGSLQKPLIPQLKSKTKMNVHDQIATLEKNIKTITVSEDPKNKEYLWPFVQELSILYNGLAVKLIQKQKFEKSESYLLKAKQITEPMSNRLSRNWPKSKEWLLVRLAIYQNLALIYKYQKHFQKAYELLSDFAKLVKIEVVVDRSEIIMAGGYETLYINLAHFCKKLKKYEESLFYAEKTIEFLQALLRNNGLMKQISEEMKQEKHDFDNFLMRKNALLASLLFLKGKILAKQEKEVQGLDFLNNGYLLINEYLGPNNEKTLKFKAKYEKLRNKLNFLQEMGKNTDMNDFQAFKKEIDCSQQNSDNPKDISSITELDEPENVYDGAANIEQQPHLIQRTLKKKQTANFFMPTNLLHAKSIMNNNNNTVTNNYNTEETNKSYKPSSSLAKNIKLKDIFEKDTKFDELLKNSRIIYPRNRSPLPQGLQLSFDGQAKYDKYGKKMFKTRSSSKSKTPSPNQKTQISLISGFTSSGIKSTLNSSAFYNKLRVNSSKTKALYQATIDRFFKKPKEIKPFLNTKQIKNENPMKYAKDFPKLSYGDPLSLLKQSHYEMILNKRPETPSNFYKTAMTPGIQVIPVSEQNNNEMANKITTNENKTESQVGTDEYLDPENIDESVAKSFIKRRSHKSISSALKTNPPIISNNQNKHQTQFQQPTDSFEKIMIGKRHTLSINSGKKSSNCQIKSMSSMGKAKRLSVIESLSNINTNPNSIISTANLNNLNNYNTLGSPAIKTLASIAESLGKNNNESKLCSQNNTSVESISQLSINNDQQPLKIRKNSAYINKMTGSEGLDVKAIAIPRLSRDRGTSKEEKHAKNQFQLTPQQKNHREPAYQATFQHMKFNEQNKLKTMKSLDININVNNYTTTNNQNNSSKGNGSNANTPLSPKKPETKKSISFIKDSTQILRKLQTGEQTSEEINGLNDNNGKFDFNDNSLESVLKIPSQAGISIPQPKRPSIIQKNIIDQKYEKAAKFIQKMFRKILQRKLFYMKNLMSDKKYLNSNNKKLAQDIQEKLSNMRIREVVQLLKNAKNINTYMTFQEMMSLEQFPIRFYTNALNGFGLKCVFWKLDKCILEEEFKFVMSDPNEFNINDEWKYHESFLLILLLKNSLNNTDLRLEIRTKERLSIMKNQTNYIWKVANVILDEWFIKEGYQAFYQNYIEDIQRNSEKNQQIFCFYKIHGKNMRENDRTELWGFRNRLVFLIEKMAYLIRKPIGQTWIFQEYFKETPNYSILNLERYHLLKERYIISRYLACHLGHNLGAFLSRYGKHQTINNPDPRNDIRNFYENFEPNLKESTFDVLFNNFNRKKFKIHRAKSNSEKWSKNDSSPYRSTKSRYSNMKIFAPKPPMHIEIDNSLNFASLNMNSPTKPFNLINFDLLNRYNLDEFSESESPQSKPQPQQVNSLKKKSSPKIKIMIPEKGSSNGNFFIQSNEENTGNDLDQDMQNPHLMTNSLEFPSTLKDMKLSAKVESVANIKLPGNKVEDSINMGRKSSFHDHYGFERSAHIVTNLYPENSDKTKEIHLPNLNSVKVRSNINDSHRKSFLRISPIKVDVIQRKRTSSILEYSHKGENMQIFPMKSEKHKISLPIKYINAFFHGEILAQGLVRIEKTYFLMGIYFEISEIFKDSHIIHLTNLQEAEEVLNKKIKEWLILIKLHKMKENLFKEEIRVSFERFLQLFMPNYHLTPEKILKFLYNRKFSPYELKLILKSGQKMFKIENCCIIINENKEKLPESPLSPEKALFRYSLTCEFLEENTFFSEKKLPHSYIVTFGDSINTLNNYNTIKFLNKSIYYLRIPVRKTNKIKFIRVSFISPEHSSPYVRISYYEPMNSVREYCIVTHERDLEKIINVLQIMGEKTKIKICNMYLNIRNELVGHKLYFFKEIPPRKSNSSDNSSPLTKVNIQALKLIIISNVVDPYINTYYHSKTYFELFKLDKLGNCYVKIIYYKPNEKFSSNQLLTNKIFFKFEFFPFSSKTKIYKFLISLYDIREFLHINLKFENERLMMISLNRYILKKLRLSLGNLYHSLIIPYQEISHSVSTQKKFLNYKMKFHKLAYESKETITFLQKEYCSYRTIFHITKIIQQQFCIITVQKHNFLSHWVLKIYVIKSNRQFVCYITNEDIIRMNSDFLEDLYPFEMSCINKIFQNTTNKIKYEKFSLEYTKLRVEHSHLLEHGVHGTEYSNKKCHPFIEMKFWEDLLNNMVFSLNFNKKLILSINNFKGIIREFLFHDIIERNNNNDSLIFFEVFFENKKSKSPFNIFDKLPNISYDVANHYNIYVRLTNLQYLGISNEKFTLRDLIYSYSLESLNLINIEKLNKMIFLQSELKNLCNFLKFKLRNHDYNKNIIEFVDSVAKFNKKMVIKNDNSGKVSKKLNCNINLQSIHFNKEKKFILMYKAVFTLKPLKMVTVTFAPHKMMFYIDIYNLQNCQIFLKKIPLFMVKYYLPFIKEMMSWSLFYLTGERLIKILKNSLIVESFIKTK